MTGRYAIDDDVPKPNLTRGRKVGSNGSDSDVKRDLVIKGTMLLSSEISFVDAARIIIYDWPGKPITEAYLARLISKKKSYYNV